MKPPLGTWMLSPQLLSFQTETPSRVSVQRNQTQRAEGMDSAIPRAEALRILLKEQVNSDGSFLQRRCLALHSYHLCLPVCLWGEVLPVSQPALGCVA